MVRGKRPKLQKIATHNIWSEMGVIQCFPYIHADMGSERLNSLPEIKLLFLPLLSPAIVIMLSTL